MNDSKLALPVGAVLILLATGGCQPATDTGLDPAAVNRVAQSIARNDNEASVDELAGWLVGNEAAIELIDLRGPEQFRAGHIDGADSVPVAELLGQERLGNLPSDRKIVLYSGGTGSAARAAAVLQLEGLDAHYLNGGYDAWLRAHADPASVAEAGDPGSRARRQAVQCYFEGDYVAEAGLIVKAAPTAGYVPPVQPVSQTPAPPDPLGLGLGLEAPPAASGATPAADPLGLGLGLEAAAPTPAPAPGPGAGGGGAPAGLLIGEGC